MSNTQQPTALGYADAISAGLSYTAPHILALAADELRRQHARIAELEAQLSAIGAGGVEPLRKPAAAPQAVQDAVPEAIEQMAADRYKVVPSHESMFHRWAVVAGNGTQQLYIGREGECQNMARKFMGAFLDGAFVAMQNAAPPHPAEGVPAQAAELEVDDLIDRLLNAQQDLNLAANVHMDQSIASASTLLDEVEIALRTLSATHPTQQGLELANCKGDKWLTVVYRDIQPGDEAHAIAEHPKVSALSWSHALHDRDAAVAAQAKHGGEQQ